MDLKKLLGDKYKEGMTADEMITALAEVDEPEPEAQVEAEPKEGRKVVDKEVFDKTASELARLKKDLKNAENQNKSVEEQSAQKIKELEASVTRLNAEKILSGLDIDYTEFLDNVLDESSSAIDVVQSLATIVKSVKEAAVKDAKKELINSSPKSEDSPKTETTKKLSEMTVTEQMKLLAEQPDVYKRLSEVK